MIIVRSKGTLYNIFRITEKSIGYTGIVPLALVLILFSLSLNISFYKEWTLEVNYNDFIISSRFRAISFLSLSAFAKFSAFAKCFKAVEVELLRYNSAIKE